MLKIHAISLVYAASAKRVPEPCLAIKSMTNSVQCHIQYKAAQSVRVVGILHSLRREERGVAANVRSKTQRLLAAGRDGARAVRHAPRGTILPEARATRSSVHV